MTMPALCTAVGVVTLGTLVLAQDPAFEAASIKPNSSGPRGVSNVLLSGGRYVASAATLRSIIGFAYPPLLPQQIVGGPGWLDSERYDIQAKGEGNPSADTLRLMLRSLLAERFMLRVHTETRDTPIYALTLARGDRRFGPQLKPGTADCSAHRSDAPPTDSIPPSAPSPECGFRVGTRNISGVGFQIVTTGKGVTMTQLAASLSLRAGRAVLDRTGLPGGYDVDLAFAGPATGPDAGQLGASIFTAVQEQLGLRLESTTAPIDFLVIDSIDRPSPD